MVNRKINYHKYQKEIADEYGTQIATLLEHFGFWYDKVRSEDHQFFEGEYWVRMKIGVIQRYFSYWSEDQIWRQVKKMCELSLLKKGEFNTKKRDRTKWYTLTEKSKELLGYKPRKNTICTSRRITNSRPRRIANSMYKEEDKTKEDVFTGAFSFLQKLNPVEIEAWLMQNKRSIADFDRFLEYYEIVVQQEEIPFTFNSLFGRLRKLKFNWKGSKTSRIEDELQPIIKRKRIGIN